MNIHASQDNIQRLWIEDNHLQSIRFFEDAIQLDPSELENYWYLGLVYLLQGEEETAQLIWLSAIAEQGNEESGNIFQSLTHTLEAQAEQLANHQKFREACVVRHHIHEFSPQDLTNLLLLIDLSIKLEEFLEGSLEDLGMIELLQSRATVVEPALLIAVLEKVLQYPAAETLRFAEVCLPYIESVEKWSEILVSAAATFAFERKLTHFAVALLKLCLQYEPENIVALGYLPQFYTDCHFYIEAVEAARDFYQRCTTPDSLFFANCVLFQALVKRGDWAEIPTVGNQLKEMISELIKSQSTNLSLNKIRFLIVNTGLFLYLKDDIKENRQLQNKSSQLFLKNIQENASKSINPISINFNRSSEHLRVGYIASTLRNHSVGWLSRWLFQHHDREAFNLSIYLVNQRPDNHFFEEWFANQVDQYRFLPNDIGEAVKIIRNDKLDILVDLDSVTLDQTCTIMALKPAPIQATWLGYDASGLPTIDYFIADPYVLLDNAQAHYQEKIWRLPHTYIAVDGFEVGVPTLRRSDLDIPDNSVVYWSSQAGLKRNPHIVHLQMQILREVSNSYFLVKGIGDQDIIHDFFTRIAQEEGVSPERLRFLPMTADEYVHRANLQIADVVLDTYPYNGATTTLETLWAGVPLVTRVGQQFSSRNSYAFMMNVGVTEGIAWTDAEYVEWGIRLGQDEFLRQQVSWKLKQSRHTSPLWNAKQFTREMEDAYRSMWTLHLEQQ